MLRVGAIQLRTSADRKATLSKARSLIDLAAQRGAQLVCLPEAWTGLYGVGHFASNAEQWKGEDSGTKLMAEAAANHGLYVVGGVIEQHPTNKEILYNTIAAFDPRGNEVARYRKMHLSRVSVGADNTSEGTVLEAGDRLGYFDVPDDSDDGDGCGWRIGLANCFDLRFKDLSDMLTAPPPKGLGSDVILYPSSWLKSTGDMGHWETLLKARALDGQCYTMGISNARDDTQQTVAFGRSCIMGPLGETVAVCADDTADEVVMAELRLDHLVEARRRIPLSTSRRPETYEDALRSMQADPVAMARQPDRARKRQKCFA
eukprot:TRINITY_DN73177_c0_g1_i1.p1 TRINITY_DN73177_c0_g1~~TRINITY_DN73177_c0_g1_i1.p1  ORF type:complete len:331 (+),score=41.10 TRINITY_DN73177_c0_g1_i1:45-995(+)